MQMLNDPRLDKQIRALPFKDNSKVVRVIDLFELKGFELTETHLKKVEKGLWELRAGRWRLLFGVIEKVAVGVVLFLKKTQKTPQKEIATALRRLQEYL